MNIYGNFFEALGETLYKARALEIHQQLGVTTLRLNQSFLGIFLTALEFRVRCHWKVGERTKMS